MTDTSFAAAEAVDHGLYHSHLSAWHDSLQRLHEDRPDSCRTAKAVDMILMVPLSRGPTCNLGVEVQLATPMGSRPC